jgi:hypothetical protein
MSQTGGRSTGWRAQALRNRWRPVRPVVAGRVAFVTATVIGTILTSPAGFEQQLAPDFSRNFVQRTVFNYAKYEKRTARITRVAFASA